MGKIQIRLSEEELDAAQSSGDFEQAPPGLYLVEIVSIEKKRKEGGEHDYLNARARLIGSGREGKALDKKYGDVWDVLSFSPASKWRLGQFLLALGIDVVANKNIGLEIEPGKPGTVIGKKVLLRVKSGKNLSNPDEYRAEAGNWSPLTAPDEDGDEFAEEDLADDGAAVNPFEEEPEGTNLISEDEGTDEDEDYYTKESLEALDNKELAAVLPEFDLESSELKVFTGRGKAKKLDLEATRAAFVEAILEAQGAEEDGSDTGAEEDPF